MSQEVSFTLPTLEDIRAIVREEIARQDRTSDITTPEELLTIKQTSELLKVSTVTVWDWSRKGILKKYYVNGNPRYKRSEVIEALTLMVSKKKQNKPE